MDETKKPFECEECEMSFTNEDHLSVHTKKHLMCLQLSLCSKAASFVADQTPTPTRLIRNCDEVGLFEDLHLQHENPFDETFRRAVETKIFDDFSAPGLKEDHGEYLRSSGEDSLHTPRVLPLSDTNRTCTTIEYSNQITQTTAINESIFDCSNTKKDFKVKNNSKKKEEHNCRVKSKPVRRVLPKCPEPSSVSSNPAVQIVTILPQQLVQINNLPQLTRLVQLAPFSKPEKSDTVLSSEHNNKVDLCTQQTVRERLKEQILKGRRVEAKLQPNPVLKTIPQVQQTTLTKSTLKSKTFTTENREKFERNREAAKRYRNKMKLWKDETHLNNLKLEEENSRLKAELARLKAILLAHKDCSVTKAMAMGHDIPVGPPTILLKPAKQIQNFLVDSKSQAIGKEEIVLNQMYFIVNSSESSKDIELPSKSS